MPKHKARIHYKGFSADESETRKSGQSDYLEYMADLLLELEEMAKREGHRELAERLRHSRQATRRG